MTVAPRGAISGRYRAQTMIGWREYGPVRRRYAALASISSMRT
jgi:hypothetical protein